MNRRKGVPCGCDADPCGCSPKNHCVKAINNVSPDPNGDFGIAAGENVTITETEYGIEIAASGGGSAEDAVKSVNGELPDQDGDVTVDTGIMNVNGVSADADGEVTITAGNNITITPDADTNSIEISATVVAPQGFTLVPDKLWTRYAVNNIAQTDLYIIVYGGTPTLYGETFVPKGMDVRYIALDLQATNAPYADYKYATVSNTPVSNILNDSTSMINFGYKSLIYRDNSSSTIDSYFSIDFTSGNSSMHKSITIDTIGIKLFVKEVL